MIQFIDTRKVNLRILIKNLSQEFGKIASVIKFFDFMDINTFYSSQNASKAKGLAIVIDVLRAFTTACFVMNNGAKRIIPVADINQAYKLKKESPDYILMGERNGRMPVGFDFGNSPAEIQNVDFANKTVIHATTVGTKGIINTVNADEIITGAFVNSNAVISYIKQRKPKVISLVCTDAKDKENEDVMFAKYIKSYLKGKPLDFKKIKKHLENHSCAEGFLVNPMTSFSKQDFYLSLDLNRFNFVLKVKKDKNNLVYLEKIEIDS